MPDGTLLVSDARAVTPAEQRRRERGLLEGAALGETHLHVSTLDGAVVGLGAFHRTPVHASRDGVLAWRRHTGGRAAASGTGFLVVTLALPHRASLVADEPRALRPEQVMNRTVRGILAWLRSIGVDALYPGLDAITLKRREIARLGFVETRGGATLFQAVLAMSATFADTPRLLDRIDPEGRVPTRILTADECTTVEREARTPVALDDTTLLARDIAAGFAKTFPKTIAAIEEIDPAVTALLEEDDSEPAPEPDDPRQSEAYANGVLGEVRAAAVVEDGRIVAASLGGDLLAPDWVIPELCTRLIGQPASADAVKATVVATLDGEQCYVLAMRSDAIGELLARAATAPRDAASTRP